VAESVDLVAECVDPPLRFDESLGERLAAAALADEVDEVATLEMSGVLSWSGIRGECA
jgi:hypothetical protein